MSGERISPGERPQGLPFEIARRAAVDVFTTNVREHSRPCFRYEVLGIENLDILRKLLTEKKTVTAVLDHRSFADVVTGAYAGILEHFDDLVRRAHIVAKLSYAERFPENLLVQYLNFIPVVSHTMKDHLQRDKINAAAVEKAQNMPPGSLLVIAPQGTRSGEVPIGKVRRGAERFWHGNDERWVLPVAIEGTEKQWPRDRVGGIIPTILYYGVWGRFIKARIIFGEPILVSEIDARAKRLATLLGEDETKFRTELVMAEIARLHIEQGDPRYAGEYYTNLLGIVKKIEQEVAPVG